MNIAYFDCFSGISGDMCLGALISAGVDFELLKGELTKLPVHGYVLRCEKVMRSGITAANIFVDMLDEVQPERYLADIKRVIDNSELPERVKEKSKAVFDRLAAAEAIVHDTTPEHVQFHEVGAVDAIVDVVGTVLGLNLLGVQRVYASPLPMGKGFIKCMHGMIPSPAPATLEILHNVPIYGAGTEGELVTPTGAALISTLAEDFIDLPALVVKKIGYGAGKKVMERPNLLRLIVGDKHDQHLHPHEHKHGESNHSHPHQHGQLHT
ncbi:MAG: nickel pincer cofactor biosynthesis protein LarC [Desulfotomaculaceae bacterium]|nr:nickel pincer cofactor biosynthesis protein LarC [Desulfotomaculaceae bacterium]